MPYMTSNTSFWKVLSAAMLSLGIVVGMVSVSISGMD
jgi:hypothetical protein